MSAPGLTSREIALAVIPHVTGGLSMLGSSFIAYTVLSSKHKRTKTYHRLLVAMSISDVISSFMYFLSTWPIPQVGDEGVGGWSKACEGCSPYHYASVGTQGTCTTQGFGMQFGMMTTASYNVMLAIHYLLTIRWNFSERQLKTKVEPYMLVLPPIIGLGLSLPELFLRYYNDTNLWCWIKASWEYEDAVQRTYDARWYFAYGPLWAFIGFITLAQIYLWYTVRSIEQRTVKFRYNFSNTTTNTSSSNDKKQQQTTTLKHSRRVAQQAALYVGVFYVTNLPYTIIAATRKFYNPHTTDGFIALLAVVICAPLQGFLNLFVYRRHQIVDVIAATGTPPPSPRILMQTVTKSFRNSSLGKTFRSSSNIILGKSFRRNNSFNGQQLDQTNETNKDSGEEGNNDSNSTEDVDPAKRNISKEETGSTSEQMMEEGEENNVTFSSDNDVDDHHNAECDPFIPSHVSEVYED